MFIRFRLFCLGVVCSALLGSCGTAQENTQVDTQAATGAADPVSIARSIIAGEHLVTEIPEAWLKIRDSKVANLHVAEYVPPDTIDVWAEKLSIEAMQGDDLPDPLMYLDGIATDQAKLCDGFANNPIFAGYENGYEVVVRLLECRKNTRTGKPIVSMLKAIKGNQSMYTISRFWRLSTPVTEDDVLDIDQNAIGAWSNVLADTYVCDASQEAHPCKRS